MDRRVPFALVALALLLVGCGGRDGAKPGGGSGSAEPLDGPIRIAIDLNDPAKSKGTLVRGNQPTSFQVGYGRYGVTCAGTRFEEGYTPLGRFKVNAILSQDQFVMAPQLIKQSGKSEAELKTMLFKNMSAIDFSGDGEVGEYGIGYISLEPIDSVKQPFRFNDYDGKFRWYSFAIHGSNNEARVGEKVTGGCLNVKEPILKTLLKIVSLGDEVVVTANGPCTP
ncbi:L,D-transpeptidase [Synechococcus sp. BS55D]|uniref:L,D-transpeptidase n=1 Tax=Synechococcus sp. BS55D TaxID=2055943 RepID=UPI00103EB596|nr:L,D-transpeptidase family protein [Synechococcus sp. BS55D]TCD56353.1 L,D-transpeptidase [Synechococcus sp. BS55D]